MEAEGGIQLDANESKTLSQPMADLLKAAYAIAQNRKTNVPHVACGAMGAYMGRGIVVVVAALSLSLKNTRSEAA